MADNREEYLRGKESRVASRRVWPERARRDSRVISLARALSRRLSPASAS